MYHGMAIAWLISIFIGRLNPSPVVGEAIVSHQTHTNTEVLSGFCSPQITWRTASLPLYCFDLDKIYQSEASWKTPTHRYFTGGITFDPACGAVQLSARDTVIFGKCDSTFYAKLYRKFQAIDNLGNQWDTVQVMTFQKADRKRLFFPKDTILQTCSPTGAAIPTLTPFWISTFKDTVLLSNLSCGFIGMIKTAEIASCKLGRSIQRIATLFDPCLQQTIAVDTVNIFIGDTQAPIVKTPVLIQDVRLGPMACTGSIPTSYDALRQIFPISVSDCDLAQVNLSVKTLKLLPNGIDSSYQATIYPVVNGFLTNIPIGKNRLIIKAVDGCGNSKTDSLIFRVVDLTAPVINCPADQMLSLDNNGAARLSAADFSNSVTDNCGIKWVKIRRLVTRACLSIFDRNGNGRLDLGDGLVSENGTFYTPLVSYLDFQCCDLNANALLEIWAEDLAGNRSRCTFGLEVSDPTLPICLPPNDTTVLCNDENLWDPTFFGKAKVLNDPCGQIIVRELSPIETFDNCGVGQLVRRWQAVKNANTTREIKSREVKQIIQVKGIRDYGFRLPADTAVVCSKLKDAPKLSLQENGCDLLAFSYSDNRSLPVGNECYIIYRTFQIINWCEFKENKPIVSITRDPAKNGKLGEKAFWVLVRQDGKTYLDADNDETNANPTSKGYFTDSDETPAITSTGRWQYTQIIRVYDNTPPSLSATDNLQFSGRFSDCSGDVNLALTVNEDCSPETITFLIQFDRDSDGSIDQELPPSALAGTYPRYRIQGRFPFGKHLFMVTATDGCGNVTRRTIPFSVLDKEGPKPNCINGLVVNLSPVAPNTDVDGDGDIDRGAVSIFATDLIAKEGSDCSGTIRYSIFKSDDIESGAIKPNPDNSSLILTCDDRPSVLVYVYAWDVWGNKQYCETYVYVDDSKYKTCPQPGTASINGMIRTYTNSVVPRIPVKLSSNLRTTDTTDNKGVFNFSQLEAFNNYTITPQSPNDYSNGVSTYDLVMLTRHILNEERLTSPYQYIAGDIDRSGSITTLDVLLLRRLVLRLDQKFARNTSWRFIDASYRFPDALNPFAEEPPALRRVNNLDGQLLDVDFIGIKIGDINGNVDINAANANAVELRSQAAPITMNLDNQHLVAGKTYKIQLELKDLAQLQGLQYGLQFNPAALELNGIQYATLQEEDLNLNDLERGLMQFSWSRGISLGGDLNSTALCTLEFTALQTGELEEFVQFSNRLLHPEAYTEDLQIHPLELFWNGKNTAGADNDPVFQLHQNRPNPFGEDTVIEFDLPTPERATLVIRDVAGRTLYRTSASYLAGRHQITVSKSELGAQGLLYYSLETPKFAATKRMVVLNTN